MRVATLLPSRQTLQFRAAMDAKDEIWVANSWEHLEALVRLQPVSVVVFNPAADGTMNVMTACKLIRDYGSTPFVAYVPVDAPFVRGIAHMANDGLQEVVVYRSNDSPVRFRETLSRVSSIPQVNALLERLQPFFQRLPGSLADVVIDTLRQPHNYTNAEDVAVAADVTVSALYRSFRNASLSSPKSFVVGARVFSGYIYLRDTGVCVRDVAVKLRYTHPRIFARHIECVLGQCPSTVRRSMNDDEAIARLLAWLVSASQTPRRLLKQRLSRVVCPLSISLAVLLTSLVDIRVRSGTDPKAVNDAGFGVVYHTDWRV